MPIKPMIKPIRKSGDQISVLVEARRAVADGTASADLIEQAYRVAELFPYDPRDAGLLAAAQDAGVVQLSHLEGANGVEGWERLQLRHADGRREPLYVSMYRQVDPERVRFDCDIEIAAGRIAKALPRNDPRQGEIAVLTAARAFVRKALNQQVSQFTPTTSIDACNLVHAFGDAWDDHHRLQLVTIAETPASYATALPKGEIAVIEAPQVSA